MNIESPVKSYRRRSSLDRKPIPDASLASLSTESNEIVSRLLRPGIMGGENCDDTKKGVEWWQEDSVKPNISTRSRMPGTLHTPTPSFFLPTQEPVKDHVASSGSFPTAAIPRARPPVRSMSTEERQAFITELNQCSKAPPACVYVLPIQDIPAIKRSAEKVGFHARIATSCGTDEDVTDGWLILGRDKMAVEALQAKLECEKGQGVTLGQKNRRGRLGAAAGGAIVGAVATWTGLAFS